MTTTMQHMPPLVVDGGELTVLRRMAAYTWGTWSVTWPEDFEPPELAPDRELGFVAKLPTPEGGKFSRRFVRADAEIDAANGYSNVESILDEAEERTGGDVFFERDTTNLGRLIPGVHFQKGDVIPVRVWGRIIRLPVTAIDEVSEQGVVVGWRVHVGGQLISDTAELDSNNRNLERQIAQERRERMQADGLIDQKATAADDRSQGTAAGLTGDPDGDVSAAWDDDSTPIGGVKSSSEKAVADAKAAQERAEELTGVLAGTVSGDLSPAVQEANDRFAQVARDAETAEQWTVSNQDDFNVSVALALIAQGKVNDFNEIAWVTLSEWQEEKDEVDKAQTWALDGLNTVVRLAFPQESIVPKYDNGIAFWFGPGASVNDYPPGYPIDTSDWSTMTIDKYRGGLHVDPDAYVTLSDMVDYKLGVWAKTPPGYPNARALFQLWDEDGDSRIQQWHRWRPQDDTWVTGDRIFIRPDQGGENGWFRYEYIFRLKPGTRRVQVVLGSGGSSGNAYLNRLDFNVFNRPQEELDNFQNDQIAENQALGERLENNIQKMDAIQRLLIGSTHQNVDYEIDNTAVGTGFVELYSFTVATNITYDVYYRIGWDAADRGTTYRLSIAINGSEQYWLTTNRMGPNFPWEDGYRTMSMTRNGVYLREGDTISFRVRSTGSPSQRRVRNGVVNMSQSL